MHIVSQKREKAAVALLVDDSASMQIKNQNHSRADRMNQILQSNDFKKLQDRYDIHRYRLSEYNDLRSVTISDSILFEGTSTDIAGGLKAIEQKKGEIPFSGILLFSDGQWNTGEDPARISQSILLPVFSMVFGDDRQQKDLIISRIQTNEVVYANDQVPIEISVRGPGYDRMPATLTLQEADSVYHSEQIQIPKDGLEKTVRFFYTPREEGFHVMTASLSHADNEITYANNERDITWHVLKSKWKVLLLAHGPSPDLAFLKRLIEKDEHVQLTVRTQKNIGGFYEGDLPSQQALDSLDLLMFLDYPSADTPKHIWDNISRLLADSKPFFLTAGKHLDMNRFSSLPTILPFTALHSQSDAKLAPRLTQTGQIHTLTQIREDLNVNKDSWNRLPPIFYSWRSVRAKPESKVLVEAVPEHTDTALPEMRFPLFLVGHFGNEKSAVLLGSGFYRWDLLMWGIGKDHEILKGLLSRTMRWLVTRDEADRFLLKTDKQTYRSGEQVMIMVQVYDDILQPIDDAEVEILVSHRDQEIAIHLSLKEQGLYTGSFRISDKGIYKLSAQISHQNQVIGNADRDISSDTFNPEFLETRANSHLMRKIANSTGGRFATPDSLSVWANTIDFPTRLVEITQKIRLYNTLWLLIITLFFLSAEWLVRKRKGML